MNIYNNLQNQLKEQILSYFEKNKFFYGHKKNKNKAIKKLNTDKLLELYIYLQKRMITPIKRNVILSNELIYKITHKEINNDLINVINIIKMEFENGIDVNPRLSKSLEQISFNDKLLNDWNIYHLHLSNHKNNKEYYFYDRTSQLLFIYLTNSTAYFLDICDEHKNNPVIFSQQKLLKIIDDNWHDLLSKYRLSEIVSVDVKDDLNRAIARNKNTFYLETINGKVYLPPGGGLTSAGTSQRCLKITDDIINEIKTILYYYLKKYQSSNSINNLFFKIKLEKDKIILSEEKTNMHFPIKF
ncbi:hypothetical protein [uncultured Megamonas sp.]|uniref:hypothetical protein n=1 Tax=uncultured Megamonas sp. TaxID=286140 RepID=UPI00259B9781|nr:hypothetical protein [uncultured Megamonas sp.]